MKFELKNIKHAEFASEETNCYQASLYIDGKRVGQVSNDGHGGCDMVHPVGDSDKARKENRAKIDAAEKYLSEQPEIESSIKNGDGSNFRYSQSLETKCHELLSQWMIERDVKRSLSRKVMFVKPGKKGIFYYKGLKPADAKRAQMKNPDVKVLNLMPMKEVVALWKQESA